MEEDKSRRPVGFEDKYMADMETSAKFSEALEKHTGFHRPFQVKVICFILLISSLIQLIIILSFVRDGGIPWFFLVYYHSVLFISLIAIFGVWYFQRWGWYLILFSTLSQILTQVYLLVFYFQMNQVFDRLLQITVFCFIFSYFLKDDIRSMYFKPLKDVFYIRR